MTPIEYITATMLGTLAPPPAAGRVVALLGPDEIGPEAKGPTINVWWIKKKAAMAADPVLAKYHKAHRQKVRSAYRARLIAEGRYDAVVEANRTKERQTRLNWSKEKREAELARKRAYSKARYIAKTSCRTS